MEAFDVLNKMYNKILSKEFFDFIFDLNNKTILLRDTNISSRNFNHWKKEGLIYDIKSDSSRKWEKLSFVELIWLNCIMELRSFDISLENIKDIKEKLFEKYDFQIFKGIDDPALRDFVTKTYIAKLSASIQDSDMNATEKEKILKAIKNTTYEMAIDSIPDLSIFHLILISTITYPQEIGFILYSDGLMEVFLEDLLNYTGFNTSDLYKSHVYISITKQFYNFLTDTNKAKYHNQYKLLTEEETEIMSFIRDKNWDLVKIEKKENLTFITAESKGPYNSDDYQNWKREILKNHLFFKISENYQNGKKTSLLLTVTHKIKK